MNLKTLSSASKLSSPTLTSTRAKTLLRSICRSPKKCLRNMEMKKRSSITNNRRNRNKKDNKRKSIITKREETTMEKKREDPKISEKNLRKKIQ